MQRHLTEPVQRLTPNSQQVSNTMCCYYVHCPVVEVFIAYACMGPVWAHVRSKWCLVWQLFRAYCVRAGGLPWVSVLEVCSEHTWFNFAHGIVKPMFRAYTTRRLRAKRSPKTVLFRAFMTDFYIFPGFFCVHQQSEPNAWGSSACVPETGAILFQKWHLIPSQSSSMVQQYVC